MIKKTITYTDYEGVERTEDFFFNLSKPELIDLELSEDGGMQNKLQRIIAAKDVKEIIEIMKNLIYISYGEKTDDGKRFVKSKELSDSFVQTEAYSELFMQLSTDDKAASEFIKGIIPANLAAEMEKVNTSNPNISVVPEKVTGEVVNKQ